MRRGATKAIPPTWLTPMPELPEVETVRRGLQPVMEGARFVRVEARRPDLRRPLPKDFVKRLEGRDVTGLGRRAKYLLADLSSGDVLMMHLGMSGSFRVAEQGRGEATPGDFLYPRSEDRAHDHIVFHMSSGARISFTDPRRFGLMLLAPRGAPPRAPGAQAHSLAHREPIGCAERTCRGVSGCHQGGARRRHQGGRLVA